ncbi:MAG: GIY-YIG nuclease family protein [Patescibacteria group bacterium]
MPFYFYLARCKDKSLYAGYCVNIKNREAVHNDGKGAKYTNARRPVKIVYHEKFTTRSEAMQREAQVKKFTRSEKLKLAKHNLKG